MLSTIPRRLCSGLATACCLLGSSAALRAQQTPPASPPATPPVAPADSQLTNTDVPWRTSYFPFITGLTNDGPLIAFRVRRFKAAPYEDRIVSRAAYEFDAGIGFRGSRFALATLSLPRLGDGWRLFALGAAVREARFGFYGLGNETTFDQTNTENGHDLFYRVLRRSYRAQLEVTRRLVGPLHLALLGEAVSSHFVAPENQPSVFGTEFGTDLSQQDASARLALVLDTRDVEYDTHTGVLLEAGAQAGSAGGGYQRGYAILRGWAQPVTGTVLAARLVGSQMYGTPSLDSRLVIPGWERPIPVLGGQFSHRGLDTPRFVGKGVLLGNFELRQNLKSFGDLGAINLLAFLDAGRVFEDTRFTVTFDNLKVGGGGGVAFRILRSTIFTVYVGRGPERTTFNVTSGWIF